MLSSLVNGNSNVIFLVGLAARNTVSHPQSKLNTYYPFPEKVPKFKKEAADVNTQNKSLVKPMQKEVG